MNFFTLLSFAVFFALNLFGINIDDKILCQRLHHAVADGDVGATAQLVRKVNVDCQDEYGRTAMHIWVEIDGPREIFFQLFYRGSALLDVSAQDGTTPLMAAVIHQRRSAIITLLQASLNHNLININVQNRLAFTPVHIAVLNNNLEFVRMLRSMGANLSALDHQGRTPYDLAIAAGHISIARELSLQKF